jgi:hypothetical protein
MSSLLNRQEHKERAKFAKLCGLYAKTLKSNFTNLAVKKEEK